MESITLRQNKYQPLFKILLLANILTAGVYIILAVYISNRVYQDTKVLSDAILILGARSYKDAKINPCLEARVNQGIKLYKEGYAPTIIVSGGKDRENGTNEAEIMKTLLLNSGINKSVILTENQSTSTYENLLFSKQIMVRNQLKTIIIVTEPFHEPRADLVAQRLNISHTISPAIYSPCWTRWKFLSRYFLKEPLLIIYYGITGRI